MIMFDGTNDYLSVDTTDSSASGWITFTFDCGGAMEEQTFFKEWLRLLDQETELKKFYSTVDDPRNKELVR